MEILTDVSKIVLVVGIMAVAVSLITEGLKAVKTIDLMPTRLVAYLVSLVITPISYVGYMTYLNEPIEWFMVFASFLAAFMIAKVSIGGWDEVMELINRCMKKR